MPSAEIITIGTEILLGEIQDTNTSYLARCLRGIGLDLYRTTSIGDNSGRIAQVINEAAKRCDVIITTGGLGPTVDDPTRQAVSQALGRELVFRPELWQKIQERFHRAGRTASENNRRQAYIPDGAVVIENPVGTAPAFYFETEKNTIISLPGVPREMEYLIQNNVLSYLKERYHLTGIIKARVLHAATVGESMIDERIGDLEQLGNPTVGLLAHPGQTDIRITAKADREEDANQMIDLLASEIYKRLGKMIYGEDRQTLEGVVDQLLTEQNLRLRLMISGFETTVQECLSRLNSTRIQITPLKIKDDSDLLEEYKKITPQAEELVIACRLSQMEKVHNLDLVIQLHDEIRQNNWHFSSESSLAPVWAANITMDYARLVLQIDYPTKKVRENEVH
jgi:competence/damage-inducible protein CinA-like protein